MKSEKKKKNIYIDELSTEGSLGVGEARRRTYLYAQNGYNFKQKGLRSERQFMQVGVCARASSSEKQEKI